MRVMQDIFSLGVIFCEVLSRTLASTTAFARHPPYFGIDADEVRERASPGCPALLLDMALAMCDVDPVKRPTIRVILDRLHSIEAHVDEVAGPTCHIGSVRFGAQATTLRRSTGRPRKYGRIPSFDGQVSVPQSREEESDIGAGEGSDKSFQTALAALENVRLDSSIFGCRGPSTMRGTDATWSDATVRPAPSSQSSSNPSVPSSGITSQSFSQIPSSLLTLLQAPVDDHRALTEALDSETSSAGSSAPSTPPQQAVPDEPSLDKEEKGTTEANGSLRMAWTSTASIAAATLGHSVSQERGQMEQPFSRITVRPTTSLHRFTLVKPGWWSLTGAAAEWSAELINKKTSGGGNVPRKRVSIDTPGGIEATMEHIGGGGSGGGGCGGRQATNRCRYCEKKFGILRQYLECDDCGMRCVGSGSVSCFLSPGC
jgi:LIM domain kinase 1